MTPRNFVERRQIFAKHFAERILPNPKLVKQFHHCLDLFLAGRTDLVHDHALQAPLAGKRAFAVTNDIRVIYIQFDTTIVLYDIGTHDEVYR